MPMQAKFFVKSLAMIGMTTLLAAAAQALVQAPGPGSIAGLSLHLEADSGMTLDGNNDVITWLDQSALHHDASGVSGYYAQVNGAMMNGIAVPTFSDSYLTIAGQPVTSQQFTIFTVAATPQTGSSDGFREVVSNWSGSNTVTSVFLGTVGYSAVPDTTLRFTDDVGGASDVSHLQTGVASVANPAAGFVLSGVSDLAASSLYLGQALVHGAAALTTRDLSGGWLIGSQGGFFENWNGQIAALIIYDRALDDAERTLVIDYLGQKYLAAPAVPEPASWALMLGGLFGLFGMSGLGALARRRRD